MSDPYLSKSRYLSGLQCDRRLWLDAHDRDRATPMGESQGHILEMGNEVGRAAHNLFPGGVLAYDPEAGHESAVLETRRLIADASVPAIFEAAFLYNGVRIRVDALERLEAGRFGLREVKASSRLKRESNLPDLAIQLWVLEGAGLDIASAQLVHLNGKYVRGEGEIDWDALFVREELLEELAEVDRAGITREVEAMHGVLASKSRPFREPGDFCKRPFRCRYWEDCTASRVPAEESSSEPELTHPHYDVAGLSAALEQVAFPVWALDFEAIGPGIPLYPKTRPYQAIAFQWSLHRLQADGRVDHFEFLADGREDPRPSLAKALIERLGEGEGSILAYSGYESRCLKDMAKRCPELAESLSAISSRLVDLLPIVQRNVQHPEFKGSYSMKSVGPALAGEVAYDDLTGVANGLGALSVFSGIVKGQYSEAEEAQLRRELLAYCKLDTGALLGVYQALVQQAEAHEK